MMSLVGIDAAGQVVLDAEGLARITLASLWVGGWPTKRSSEFEVEAALLPIGGLLNGVNGTLAAVVSQR